MRVWREGTRIRQEDGAGYADRVSDDAIARHVADALIAPAAGDGDDPVRLGRAVDPRARTPDERHLATRRQPGEGGDGVSASPTCQGSWQPANTNAVFAKCIVCCLWVQVLPDGRYPLHNGAPACPPRLLQEVPDERRALLQRQRGPHERIGSGHDVPLLRRGR